MTEDKAPWHAHSYYEAEKRGAAGTVRAAFAELIASGDGPGMEGSR